MKNNYACIYSSSYDRGLENLLKIWPEVKAAVPEAELHIFYGWQLFDKFYHGNPASMAWKARMVELMKAPGITEHGRVPQDELKTWYEKCGIWAYPTHFMEISCISAMKAQAYGAIPVVTDFAALETTVQYGYKVQGEISLNYVPQDVMEVYKNKLIELLKDHNKQEEIRKPMMEWATNEFSWPSVAKQWSQEFKSDPLKDAMDVLLLANPEAAKYLPVQMQQQYGLEETF